MRSKIVVRYAMAIIVPTLYLTLVGALTATEMEINRPAAAIILVGFGVVAFFVTALVAGLIATDSLGQDTDPAARK